MVLEVGQPQHFLPVTPARSGVSPTALPSPPSQGGGTFSVSGHATWGNRVGPYRAALPAVFACSALMIFSGVIGTSSTRTPIASYTALATAGTTGSSGPWPTSFAPNGPRGSGSSTSSVNTSGMSRVVGLLYSSIDGNLCTSACDSFGGSRRNVCSSISASP